MKSAVIYGASMTGKDVYRQVKGKYDILFFVDRNPALIGQTFDGIPIKTDEDVLQALPDLLIMGVLTGYEAAAEKFIDRGFPSEHIITSYVDLPHRARTKALESVATIIEEKNVLGAVAELGVYMGDFSKEINRVFPDRTLYLFDTFEGFPAEDLRHDEENDLLFTKVGNLSNTSVDIVRGKLSYPEKCEIRKGYFPETAVGLESEKFAFVNIDVDLYKPILAGLRFFYPRLSPYGYIFVHDYFSLSYAGARKAIEEFAEEHRLTFTPIGDTLSIAFCRNGE